MCQKLGLQQFLLIISQSSFCPTGTKPTDMECVEQDIEQPPTVAPTATMTSTTAESTESTDSVTSPTTESTDSSSSGSTSII